jgi:hypothetical protein
LHNAHGQVGFNKTIVHRMKIREENIYLLLNLLFSQYLYADLTRCHVSMVNGSATTKSSRQHHRQHDLVETMRRDQVASATSSPA